MELIKQKIAEDENKLKDIDENILNCSDLG